jgi:hypothetical protein
MTTGRPEPARRNELAERHRAAGILADEDLGWPPSRIRLLVGIGLERPALLQDLGMRQGGDRPTGSITRIR